MIGLPQGSVKLADFDPGWQRAYTRQRNRIAAQLATQDISVHIEHIGSTAIRDLRAKPIIDMVVGFGSIEERERGLRILEQLGFDYVPAANRPGVLFMAKGTPRTHHLHLVTHRSLQWTALIEFRNYVSRRPSVRVWYGDVKERLAAQYPNDRLSYSEAKRPYTELIAERAMAQWRERARQKAQRNSAMARRRLRQANGSYGDQ